jgi:very-short-patch-repair endonuclease
MVRASRLRGQKFRREYPIPPYTVDFVCLALKLIVEVDGKDHLSDEGIQHDQRRDQFLRAQGYEILRIEGYRVTKDALGVSQEIESAIDQRMQQQDFIEHENQR